MFFSDFSQAVDAPYYPHLQQSVAAGIGLKSQHFRDLLQTRPAIGFLEVHAENYLVDGGPFHHYLTELRAMYPLSIHGVGLSIGAESLPDGEHLKRLAQLVNRYQPQSFSEHLAWSTHNEVFYNDLLPLAYDKATLSRVCDHIDIVQNALGRTILIENPATYVEFAASSMSEEDFISVLVSRSGCGLLLDISNVYVGCTNHRRNPHDYIRALPLAAVGEVHLAGFAAAQDIDGSPLLIDSHDRAVSQKVWELYQFALRLTGPVATLIERDGHVPALHELVAEAALASPYLNVANIEHAVVLS